MNISCVIVTRGNVDMTDILASLPFDDVVVWNNSVRDDIGIYGRFAAIAEAKHDIIYTQDDDVLVTGLDELLASYEPGIVSINYDEPWDIPWISKGAVFDRHLPEIAFRRYWAKYDYDAYFRDEACDGIFALLSEVKVANYGFIDLPHAYAQGRVSTTPGWYDDRRPEIQRRCASLL